MPEAATASVILFAAFWVGVAGLLAAMAIVDTRERRIPNELVAGTCAVWALMQVESSAFYALTGAPLTNAAQACGISEPFLHVFALPNAAVGMLTAVAAVVLLAGLNALYERLFRKQAMGAGDVKLIGAFALFLGPYPTMACIILACALALIAAVPARLRTFPFAPALVVAFACVVFVEL